MRTSKSVTLAIAATALASLSVQGQAVGYDNTTTAQTSGGNILYTDVHAPEIGDEVNLIQGDTTITQIQFEYVYTGATADGAAAVLTLYPMEAVGTGFRPIDTPLLQSTPFALENGFHTADTGPISVAVPGRFVWAVSFFGEGTGTPGGLLFYNGAGVGDGPGESADDHWERDAVNGWTLYNNALGVDNFNILITVVPEPGTVALMVAGGAALWAAARRRKQA